MQWLQTITKLPILVKGVLTAEDSKKTITPVYLTSSLSNKSSTHTTLLCDVYAARLAVQAGAAGIIVSNHGARQLDYVPSTIMALEEVSQCDHG